MGLSANLREDMHRNVFLGRFCNWNGFECRLVGRVYIGLHFGGRGFAIGKVLSANLRQARHRHAFEGGFAIGMGLSADWLEEYTLECIWGPFCDWKGFECRLAGRVYIGLHFGGRFATRWGLSANLREGMHCFAFGAPLRRFAFRALDFKLGICSHKNVLHASFDGQEIDARSAFQYDGLGTDIQSAALCDSSHANSRLAFLGISLETNPQPAPFGGLQSSSRSAFVLSVRKQNPG